MEALPVFREETTKAFPPSAHAHAQVDLICSPVYPR